MQYLTFEEYQELGGTVADETTFKMLQRKVESKLNYVTFGRVEKMYEMDMAPVEVIKSFEVDMINVTNKSDPDDIKYGIQSYSNGIESITNLSYTKNQDADTAYNSRLYRKAQEYLWEYPELFYRGRR
jgi:hypothetical protein